MTGLSARFLLYRLYYPETFLSPPPRLALTLFAYVGAQIAAIALGTLYIGTVTQHTHLGTLIQNFLFGEHWDVMGKTSWLDPSWPMLFWAVLYVIFWTLLTGLLYHQRIFFKV